MIADTADGVKSTTVVRCFAAARGAVQAIEALRAAGFGTDAIGVLARNIGEEKEIARATQTRPIESVHVGSVTGRLIGGSGGMLIGLTMAVMPGIGPVAGIATMVVTGLLGAGAGDITGGYAGALNAVGVPEPEAERLRHRFMHGDVLIVVDAGDRQVEAARILEEEGRKNG